MMECGADKESLATRIMSRSFVEYASLIRSQFPNISEDKLIDLYKFEEDTKLKLQLSKEETKRQQSTEVCLLLLLKNCSFHLL